VLQATFRSNNAIVGLSLASVLGGTEAVAVAAVVSAFTLPVMNIFAVIALTIYLNEDGKKKIDILGILKKIAKNPLIIAIALGMTCLLIRSLQIKYFGRVVFALNNQCRFFYNALNNIKSMASPYALLILGGQFDFSSSKGMLKEIVVGTAWRVVIAPLIVIGGAAVLSILGVMNCGVNEFPALIGVFGTPAAVSSAIMAGEMGNDEQLATQLVVWSSVASIFTMFLTVCILMAAGFLAV
jgi:predicted permease